MRTEKDIGSENPRAATVLGFFRAIFQGAIQKISFPKNALGGGLEPNATVTVDKVTIICYNLFDK